MKEVNTKMETRASMSQCRVLKPENRALENQNRAPEHQTHAYEPHQAPYDMDFCTHKTEIALAPVVAEQGFEPPFEIKPFLCLGKPMTSISINVGIGPTSDVFSGDMEVVAHYSAFFKQAFYNPSFYDPKTATLTLKYISTHYFEYINTYMYVGRVEASKNVPPPLCDLPKLWNLAHDFDLISGFKEEVETLLQNATPDKPGTKNSLAYLQYEVFTLGGEQEDRSELEQIVLVKTAQVIVEGREKMVDVVERMPDVMAVIFDRFATGWDCPRLPGWHEGGAEALWAKSRKWEAERIAEAAAESAEFYWYC